MAQIVLGMATSHGPMLSTPWEQWDGRVAFDRQLAQHHFRGSTHTFNEIVKLRQNEDMGAQITPDRWQSRSTACHSALNTLSEKYAAVAPDVAVIIGNDQRELFDHDNFPAFAVYWGETIESGPRTEEMLANLAPGVAIAERGFAPPEDRTYPGHPTLGLHIIECLMDSGFDVASSKFLPQGTGWCNGIPHAYGFIYRQIMKDIVIPNVPIILNTFYPPNQPRAARCHDFGREVKAAIESWDSDDRVAVFASGGLSHFVIDEALDRKVLDALARHDAETLTSIPEDLYQAGSSEIKNWIPLAAIMAECSMDMTLVDYVPCYRSEAGTGNAMGFAYWD